MKLKILKLLPYKFAVTLNFLGIKRYIQFFFFQRILRINSHVSWPVHWSSIIVKPQNIHQKGVLPFLGHHPACYIQANGKIEIGLNLRYGPNVHFISANHDLCDYAIHAKSEKIKIGDNCWIGSGSIVLSGAVLGNHVVVAAGSVVNKKFPNNVLIGGVPAKIIKELKEYKGDSHWKLLQ